jgi:hypothetical protein
MKYKCDRCLKEFTQKSNFDVHIHRKNPCKNNKELSYDLSINTPQKNAKLAETTAKKRKTCVKKSSETINNLSSINDNNTINSNIIQDLTCIYCKKTYTRKDILTRHLKNGCKMQDAINIICSDIIKQNKIILEENNILKEQLNKFEKLIKANPQKKINNIIKNKTTNSNNIIQHQQNNNINIKMVSFGDEDIKKLTEDEILSILTSKSKVFVNLIKAIHLNDRLPEYNNILVNNLRSDYCSVIDDNKLVIKNKDKMLTELIEMRLSDLKDLVSQYKANKKLPKKDLEILASVLEFLKTINLEDEDVDGNIIRPEKLVMKNIKELYKELTYIFYDNRDLVNKNITKISADEMIAYLDV